MIDTYLWQELVVFAKTGTLAKTAETYICSDETGLQS